MAPDLAFLTFPADAYFGQVYNVSWEGITGPYELYFIRGDAYPSQDFLYSGSNTELPWSPRSSLKTTYWYYFFLLDDGAGKNISTSPVNVYSADSASTSTSAILSTSTSTSTQASSSSMTLMQPSSSEPTPTATSSQPSNSDIPHPQVQHDKSSIGAIVGISIGLVGLVLLITIALLLYRKRQRQHTMGSNAVVAPERSQASETKTWSFGGSTELDSRPISYELSNHASARISELASTSN